MHPQPKTAPPDLQVPAHLRGPHGLDHQVHRMRRAALCRVCQLRERTLHHHLVRRPTIEWKVKEYEGNQTRKEKDIRGTLPGAPATRTSSPHDLVRRSCLPHGHGQCHWAFAGQLCRDGRAWPSARRTGCPWVCTKLEHSFSCASLCQRLIVACAGGAQ